MRIGVIGVQGAVSEHISSTRKALKNLGIRGEVVWVRRRRDLEGVSGLILPGGESTTISKLMERNGIFDEVRRLGLEGVPIMGTCAGLILLARTVLGAIPGQRFLKLLDAEVARNAYGRQVDSFEAPIRLTFSDRPFQGIFIRAPRILRLYGKARPIAYRGEEVVGAEEGNLIGLAFHPELADDTRVHEYFIEKIR